MRNNKRCIKQGREIVNPSFYQCMLGGRKVSENNKIGLLMLSVLAMFTGMYFYINTLPTAKYDDLFDKQNKSVINIREQSELKKSNKLTILSFESDNEMETANTEPIDDRISVYTINGIKKISLNEFNLMCRIVMNVAGGESYKCQVAVAETIINRVNSNKFPNTITDVLWQPYQYSHIENGEVTDSVMEAVTQVLEMQVFETDMMYVNEDHYFPFAEDYFNVDGMYFSKEKGCD